MRKAFFLLILALAGYIAMAQPLAETALRIKVVNEQNEGLPHATVSLLKLDSTLIRAAVTDSAGNSVFTETIKPPFVVRISHLAYQLRYLTIREEKEKIRASIIAMKPLAGLLQDVVVKSKTPLVQHLADKTVVNVDAGITNAGATVLEVLERSPGVTIDRNGGISLKGKPGVQVMIDGKLTQLDGVDLQNLLSGMSAAQVATIELIDNPSAKYDAAGNAGIINITTKKNKQKGFNGTVSTAYGQGRRPKSNSSLVFNYRTGAYNFFTTYSLNASGQLMDMYALRTYFDENDNKLSTLEQPYETRTRNTTHNLRTGVDYSVNAKTTVGLALSGTYLSRRTRGASRAFWADDMGVADSTILTNSRGTSSMKQGGLNFNARHVFSPSQELTADVDLVKYSLNTYQYFENKLDAPGSIAEASQGTIPSAITIFSAKADHSKRFASVVWEAGWKSSRVTTDNPAQYFYRQGSQWQEDLGRSNHFVYTENIHAVYSSIDKKMDRWQMQAGLRYEFTGFKASQLGNSATTDSAFTRNYNSLFPTAFITYKADSSNSFTLRAGRRINRPPFQKLNPFLFIINKYTYQRGNAFLQPQFTWNVELSHLYKDILSTSVHYNYASNYFSQVFLLDTATGIIVYTQGNVGKMENLGLTMSAQLSPASWWSASLQGTLIHKRIEGVLWQAYKASVTQFNASINNQFRFSKGWSAELSGVYITKNQNDLQEILEPTGQLGIGIAKQVLKNKGTVRVNFRDVFYTQNMEGLTFFQQTTEYFKLKWDSQVINIGFTYRFGKTMKATRRSSGGAADEIERVGTVN